MNRNKIFSIIAGIIIVLCVGALIWWMTTDSEPNGTDDTSNNIPIQGTYNTKVVYTTDAEADTAALRNDCQVRGGTFNECGTICEPGAEICADVCAFTCDLSNDSSEDGAQETGVRINQPQSKSVVSSPLTVSGEARGTWFFEGSLPVVIADATGNILVETYATSTQDWMTEDYIPFTATVTFSVNEQQRGELIIQKANPSGLPENTAEIHVPITLQPSQEATSFDWSTYTNEDLGFSINRPQAAEVQEQDGRVSFLYTGPTQRTGTEVYDGISVTVTEVTLPEGDTPPERVAALAEEGLGPNGSIVQPVRASMVNGMAAYRWVAEGLGTFTHYVVTPQETSTDAYHIYFTAPDPDNRGYTQAVNSMLASFRVQ